MAVQRGPPFSCPRPHPSAVGAISRSATGAGCVSTQNARAQERGERRVVGNTLLPELVAGRWLARWRAPAEFDLQRVAHGADGLSAIRLPASGHHSEADRVVADLRSDAH